ncbi:MAG: hypothetical protein ABSG82_05705 [Sedimentisphaerales bacterium]|jgi:hypothetical protein
MRNIFLEKPEYKIEQTAMGVWRHYGYENGTSFHEFRSHAMWHGLPFIHYTSGRSPETGRRVCAKGVIAVGRIACGIIAIGQASVGLIAIGQVSLGLILGIGQLTFGSAAIGQTAIGVAVGIGQLTTGYIAIGQIAFGKYVLAQFGVGEFVLSMTRKDSQAIEFFKGWPIIKNYIGGA